MPVNKKVIWLHRVLFSADVLMLAASLVFYLIKWSSLPDEIGVHFDGSGAFDVVDSKIFGFYPHVVGGLFIAGIAVVDRLVRKKNTGLKLTERGELLFRSELLLNLDVVLFIPSIVFTLWSRSVALQVPLNTALVVGCTEVPFLIVVLGIIVQVVTCRRHRLKTEKKERTGTMHRVSRLAAWMLTVSGIVVLIACWAMEPVKDRKLYFGNFDAYLDMRLLLVPQAMAVAAVAVSEIVSVRAVKADKPALVLLADRLKLLCGLFFFWWNLSLDDVGMIEYYSVGLFAVLCVISLVLYARQRHRPVKEDENI